MKIQKNSKEAQGRSWSTKTNRVSRSSPDQGCFTDEAFLLGSQFRSGIRYVQPYHSAGCPGLGDSCTGSLDIPTGSTKSASAQVYRRSPHSHGIPLQVHVLQVGVRGALTSSCRGICAGSYKMPRVSLVMHRFNYTGLAY